MAVGSWELVVGSWQLVVGSWQLAVGSWQLGVGSWQFVTFKLCNNNYLAITIINYLACF